MDIKLVFKTLFLLFIVFIFQSKTKIVAQNEDWKTEFSKDGKIEVQYHVGKRTDKTGEKVQLIEYTATTQTDISLQNCIEAMRNASLHKEFMGNTEESKELEKLTENEWLVYYFFEPPWPMPDNDCVMKTSLTESNDGKTVVFTGVSAPELIAKKDVKRLDYYEYEYAFEEKANKKIEFRVLVRLTPVSSGPAWMVKTWFPKGPVEFMENFIKIASRQ